MHMGGGSGMWSGVLSPKYWLGKASTFCDDSMLKGDRPSSDTNKHTLMMAPDILV